jgi:hypothetical protein
MNSIREQAIHILDIAACHAEYDWLGIAEVGGLAGYCDAAKHLACEAYFAVPGIGALGRAEAAARLREGWRMR